MDREEGFFNSHYCAIAHKRKHTPAQILLKFDVGAKELPQVEFGWILALLHWGFVEAVFQLSNFRGVIRPPCPHLVNKNTLA
jgi:hypothetical protein